MPMTRQRTRRVEARRAGGRGAAKKKPAAGPAGWLDTIASRLPGGRSARRGRAGGPTALVQGLLSKVRRLR